MEEFLTNLSEIIEEREKKVENKKELIKDLNDFSILYEELESVVSELENKYNLTHNEKDKKELEEYIKERILYQNTIKEFMNKLKIVDNELNETPKEIQDSQKVIYNLFKKREKYIFDLKKMELKAKNNLNVVDVIGPEGISIKILMEDQEKFSETMQLLGTIDKEILKHYHFLSENGYINISNFEQDNGSLEDDKTNVIEKYDKSSLIKTREKILEDLKEIENSNGRKIVYKDKYHGVNVKKIIPRHLKSKYGMLMYNLKNVEKILSNDYLPEIKIDVTLYENMTELQKIQYLANLMLQIEAQVDRSNLPYIINGKKIPFEYKDVYENLLLEMKKLQKPKVNYYSYVFDSKKYEQLDFEGKLEYIDELSKKITSNFITNPYEIIINGKKYIVDKNDIPLFKKLSDMFENLKKEGLRKVEEYNSNNKSILNNSTNSELTNITLDNHIISVPKNKLKEFVLNRSKISYIEDKINNMDNIVFDEIYFNALNEEEQIKYCQNIISSTILQNKENPVSLFMDGKEVTIDSKYTKPFTMAVSKLLDFKNKNRTVDLKIDENYLKTLNSEEEKVYYLLLIHDICNKPINELCQRKFNNKVYVFDKKYELLFENIINRYMNLYVETKNSVKISKKEFSKNIEELKKSIKKCALTLALAATGLTAAIVMCKNHDINKSQKNEYVSEFDESNNKSDNIENQDNINIFIEDENKDQNLENESNKSLFGKIFTLKDNAHIYDNEYLENNYAPKYKNDYYTIVAEHYKMPDGSKMTVKYDDEDFKSKLDFIKSNGGILESVSGVAKTGEKDYLKYEVPTGVINYSDININDNMTSDISEIVSQSSNLGRGR